MFEVYMTRNLNSFSSLGQYSFPASFWKEFENISSNITEAIHFSTALTLAHQPPYPRWHTNTSPSLPCHPRQHVNHVTQVSTSPTKARHPHHPRKHASRPPTQAHQQFTHASMLAGHPRKHATHSSTPPTQVLHPCQQVQHAISQNLPEVTLCI